MIFFPNAKINIGLHVRSKREDGFHDIESILYPLSFFDILEILPGTKEDELQCYGWDIPGNKADNLCLKALQLLRKNHNFPSLKLILYKNIQPGSGLGGGSSDAAGILVNINKIFDLKISPKQLNNYALQLGSDVPFFLVNKPCLVSGRGDKIKVINLDLKGYFYTIIYPGFPVSTRGAFRKAFVGKGEFNPEIVLNTAPSNWLGKINNDFESSIYGDYPLLAKIKSTLLKAGFEYVSLTGSGSSLYGISSKYIETHKLFEKKVSVFQGKIKD